jgi:hypothetical protein
MPAGGADLQIAHLEPWAKVNKEAAKKHQKRALKETSAPEESPTKNLSK